MSDISPAPDPPESTVRSVIAKSDIAKTLVAMSVLALWAATVVLEQFGWPPVSEGTKQILNTAITLVIGYYLGSSSGSAARAATQDVLVNKIGGILR